jgi:hypothetical protein
MRSSIIIALMLLAVSTPTSAQVSIGIGLPSVRIGISVPVYPQLVAVPGYPVYYAPQLGSNLFFYDGLYWVYAGDHWYSGAWYNGPWNVIAPEAVPLFVLRVPVRYYRHPPAYFRGWSPDAPPRWGDHWGRDWAQRHGGWDHWDRASVPAPAPLPTYQRAYSGDRYPLGDQQQAVRNQNYHYQPQDAAVRQRYQQSHGSAGAAQLHRQPAATQQPGRPQPGIRNNPPAQMQASQPHSGQPPPAPQTANRTPAKAATQQSKREPEHDREREH